jgi:hypothetical protein
MKKLLFAGFLVLGTLVIVVQTSAISESGKTSAAASAKAPKKSSTPKDLVYYRNIFSTGNNVGC